MKIVETTRIVLLDEECIKLVDNTGPIFIFTTEITPPSSVPRDTMTGFPSNYGRLTGHGPVRYVTINQNYRI